MAQSASPARERVSWEKLGRNREAILNLARRNRAHDVRIFGSVARGDARPDSDVDLLVEFHPGATLLDRVALIQDLEDLLGTHVDVVTERALHPLIRERVLSEAVAL